MIYIIIDKSHECTDFYSNSDTIVYITTNLEDAYKCWDKYYSNPADDEKWCYIYELWEFVDGYDYYNSLNNDKLKPKLIKHIDNLNN